jgi:prepilin-type N-terminal cleavage/methylation domain-containing protein
MRTRAPTARRRRGFTIVELIFVLAIVAILAGVARTAFQRSVMRARRAEAIAGLEGIYRSQQYFYALHGSFADNFDELGFVLEPGTRLDANTIQGHVYTFTVRATLLDGNPRGNFQAIATADLVSGDPLLDILMIENQLTVGP